MLDGLTDLFIYYTARARDCEGLSFPPAESSKIRQVPLASRPPAQPSRRAACYFTPCLLAAPRHAAHAANRKLLGSMPSGRSHRA
jgi:hypothetical protein